MFNHKKAAAVSLLLVVCLCVSLTGCGMEMNPLLNNPVTVAAGDNAASGGNVYELESMSKDICVIPKKSQSATNSAITANASLIINDTTNKMLYANNIYEKNYPASITKIVTALVTLKYANLDDIVTFSYDATHITEYGAKVCGFQEGDQVKLRDLLYCFLIYSGNDCGIAIAEHVSGSVKAFAKLMNREMKAIGASDSHFVNPHGLSNPKHYTTAYDLYLVFHQLLKYDLFKDIISSSHFKVKYTDKNGKKKNATFYSTNRYLTGAAIAPKGVKVIGGKTGTTIDAGSCLILYSQDKKKNDYISVVLKAPYAYSLYQQMTTLLGYVKTGK